MPVTNVPTKSAIEEMKKAWRRLDLPEHLMRILHQAVQAYHRKEYAITVIVLSTQYVCLAQMCEALGFSVLEIPRDYRDNREDANLDELKDKEYKRFEYIKHIREDGSSF